MKIRPKTKIEPILERLGSGLFGGESANSNPSRDKPSDRAPLAASSNPGVDAPSKPGPAEISDEDRECLVAYAEGRMRRAEARGFRRRLSAEPVLREAMADFIRDARGTDYGRILLAGETALAVSPFARFLDGLAAALSPRFPVLAGVYAFAAVILVGGVTCWYATVVRPANQVRAVVAQAQGEMKRGEYGAARNRLTSVLQSPKTPEPLRREAGGLFESVAVAESATLAQRREFAQAVAALDQALAVQPDRPVLLAQAADVRLQALRAAEGRPPELDRAETPQYQTKGLTFEPAGKQAELDRILDLYRRAADAASRAPAAPAGRTAPTGQGTTDISLAPGKARRDAIVLRALIGQSQVHIEKGNLAAASDALGRARTLAPDSPAVQNALGRLFLEKGRGDLARDAFQRSIHFDPAPANPARWNLDNLFGPGRTSQGTAPQSAAPHPALTQPTPSQSGGLQSTPTPSPRDDRGRNALDALFNR